MYYLNGKILDKEPYDDSIFYGKSLFETIAIINGKALFLEEHIGRLRISCKKLNIPIVENFESELSLFLKRARDLREGMLKIQVSDRNLYIKIQPFSLRNFPDGIKAGFIKNYYQNELGFYKSSNYLLNILARKEISEAGCFEGIFFNRMGHITEGTISNIFFVKDGKLKTPHLNLNILPGISREKIIQISKELEIEVQEGFFCKDDLLDAEAVFFSNSLMKKGLVWVFDLEGHKYKKNEIVHKIQNKYLKIQNTMV